MFGEAWPSWPARDFDADQAADRLPRRELLHAQRHAARSERVAACARAASDRSSTRTPKRLGSVPAGPDRHAAVGQESLRQSAAVHHRERRRVLRSAAASKARCSRIRCASTICASTCAPFTTPSSKAPTCAATSSGRCSTISSGRTAFRSASASCTSTTQRCSARRRRARTSTLEVIETQRRPGPAVAIVRPATRPIHSVRSNAAANDTVNGSLRDPHLRADPARRAALDRLLRRGRSPSGHATAMPPRGISDRLDFEDATVALDAQRIGQRAVGRAQVASRRSRPSSTHSVGTPGHQHERLVGRSLEREHVEQRAAEVGRDPAVRHVADEARACVLRGRRLPPTDSMRAGRRSFMKKSISSCARSRQPRRMNVADDCATRTACRRPSLVRSRALREAAPVALERRVQGSAAAASAARRPATARSSSRSASKSPSSAAPGR